ncbi:MAG: DUF1015 domain-containing protein [Candidatus Omnitrophica bacterium]|nr:DUF1015 domain-containing protein [Candidatus Omnitrophota bacterium]
MGKIKPFRGILYNRKKVNIAKVVTPPYDVISATMQDSFYRRDQFNIIRLALGKEDKKDTPKSNRYTRAGKTLDNWMRNNIFVKDENPSIYIYTQEYLHKGKKRTRIGFIALMKIEGPKKSGVLPHEYTLAKPKEDRLNLISKTEANLSPIFTLFKDRQNKVNKILKHFMKSRDPLFTLEAEGVIHKLWQMDEKNAIKKIQSHMRDKKIFIADGHHRYEVAVAYKKMMLNRKQFKKSYGDIMMYFSSLGESENLTILSTHRAINNIEQFDETKILNKLKKYFYITSVKSVERCIEYLEKTPKNKHAFGMYAGKNKFRILTLKGMYSVRKLVDSPKTYSLKKLDVTILHDLIVDKVLGIKKYENSVKYIMNEKDAVSIVEKGDYQVAFFLRPTRVADMRAIAEKGEMMPQKSTYFYPKLLTGLVINKF